MRKIFTLFLLTIAFSSIQQAYAGWPMGKKRFMMGASFSTFGAKDFWNINGKFTKGTSTAFSSYSLGVYGHYGLSRRTDLIFSVPLSFQNRYFSTANKTLSGLGDLSVGLSYNLVNFKFKNFISIYGGGIVPLYSQYDTQTLGLGMYGLEGKLMNTGNISIAGAKAYYNVEGGYRKFFDTSGPQQFTYLGSLGFFIDKENQIGVEVSGAESYSPDKTFIVYTGAARDYSYTRGAVSYGHVFSRRVSVFGSGFYTLTGRNVGRGYGASLQLAYRF